MRILILLLAMPFSQAFAQQFLIKAADDSSAIAYANVLFARNDSIKDMAYSNNRGQVNASVGNYDKVIISHVAFEEVTFDAGKVPPVVYMQAAENVLYEVDVSSNKKNEVAFLGKKPKRGEKTSVSYSCKLTGTMQTLLLMHNPYGEAKKIKSFIFYTKFYIYMKSTNNYLVKIIFFENNGGQLGNQVPFDLVYQINKEARGKVTVDLEKANLTLPPAGYFIGLEMIGCANTDGNDTFSPSIVFRIEKELNADGVVIERSRRTTSDWIDIYVARKEAVLEFHGGYLVPAFGLEVFE